MIDWLLRSIMPPVCHWIWLFEMHYRLTVHLAFITCSTSGSWVKTSLAKRHVSSTVLYSLAPCAKVQPRLLWLAQRMQCHLLHLYCDARRTLWLLITHRATPVEFCCQSTRERLATRKWKEKPKNRGLENAGLENSGPEIAEL